MSQVRRRRRGWHCLLGDVPNVTKIRDALQRLVDTQYFGASVQFTFIDMEITKNVAMDIIDADRNRKGLMDLVDLYLTSDYFSSSHRLRN